jgi:hypothetical protein
MATIEMGKYFDERGRSVLIYEHQLEALGLFVLKTEVGKLYPSGVSGGILSLYDLRFEKQQERFSNELIEFLKERVELSPAEIERLEAQAALRA